MDSVPADSEALSKSPEMPSTAIATPLPSQSRGASYRVLGAISASHLINDMMQSLILAMYPILKGDFHLSFVQIGLITLTYQMTASLLQPLIGLYTDRRPQPYSLPFGMASTLCGLILLAYAPTYAALLLAAAFVGLGSAIFHPESSRIARLASGGQHGLAQSVFQVGGNTGSALGPLLAAAVIVPFGQRSVVWLAWPRWWPSCCFFRSAVGTPFTTSRPSVRGFAPSLQHRTRATSSSSRSACCSF